jgi:very-short-patch-repair endonuclease
MLLEKICKTCKENKRIEEYYFSKQKNRHENDCKKCYQKKKSIKREQRIKNGAPRYIAKKKNCVDCGNLCDARPKILRCHSCSSKHQYKTHPSKAAAFKDGYKKLAQSDEYKKMLSDNMKFLRGDENFNKKLASSFSRTNRLTKVHRNIRERLNLKDLGFESERLVSKYFADELHESKKIILDINGDYVHANPKYYLEEDVILLPNSKYTAKEKWESDRLRKEKLELLGYKVVVIWESDNMEEKRKEIMELLK